MAEWEEIEALTITWSTGYGITEEIILKQIVEHAVNECDVIIICIQNTVASYLSAQGISSPNITTLRPISIASGLEIMVKIQYIKMMFRILVDWIYNRNRPYDDLVAYFNADMYGWVQEGIL